MTIPPRRYYTAYWCRKSAKPQNPNAKQGDEWLCIFKNTSRDDNDIQSHAKEYANKLIKRIKNFRYTHILGETEVAKTLSVTLSATLCWGGNYGKWNSDFY